jgi:hypothetical protein
MSAPEAAIPYERQSDPLNSRTCGAACLSMVYRSFGEEVAQAEIWPAIAKPNLFGSLASTSHLMVRDALNRRFSAVAIQARHPLQVLRLSREGGIRVILNHRLQPDAPTGHYTVLVHIDDGHVVLHDPLLGPSRRLPHSELLQLWLPRFSNSEIAGNVLIGIAPEGAATLTCEFCHTQIPSQIDCPRCRKPVGLQPHALLGCIRDGCIARMWNYICCPSCNHLWSFNEAGTTASEFPGPESPSPQPAAEPQNFDKMFAALDKFCGYVLSIPGAASHPDLQAQLGFLQGGKEKLKLAQAEELRHFRVRQDQLAALTQEARQKEEAHRKRMEELNKPSPPLDGDALGRALLKNLGFTN